MAELSSFHDVRFPLGVSFGATGGPEWRNELVTLVSGYEKRNARWAQSRRHFDAGTGLRSIADLRQVLAFFEARRGSLFAFRFRDPFDHMSGTGDAEPSPLDQVIGHSDGTKRSFALIKHYETYSRPITRPVAGSVKLAVDGVLMTEGTAFSVDTLQGEVTFLDGHVPHAGATISAGFVFDVPVRFDTDRLTASIASFQAGEIPSIPIIEVKS